MCLLWCATQLNGCQKNNCVTNSVKIFPCSFHSKAYTVITDYEWVSVSTLTPTPPQPPPLASVGVWNQNTIKRTEPCSIVNTSTPLCVLVFWFLLLSCRLHSWQGKSPPCLLAGPPTSRTGSRSWWWLRSGLQRWSWGRRAAGPQRHGRQWPLAGREMMMMMMPMLPKLRQSQQKLMVLPKLRQIHLKLIQDSIRLLPCQHRNLFKHIPNLKYIMDKDTQQQST